MYQFSLFGFDLLELNEVTVLFRLALAMLCSSILGIERSRKRRAAGMRTFILICDGSCLIMMISQFLNTAYLAGTDLGRMGAQVISGVGFICAGTILLTNHHKVTGLTTAASLWTAASVGLAIGAGFYLGAAALCVVMLIAMLGFDGYRNRLGQHTKMFHLYLIAHDKQAVNQTVQTFRDMGFHLEELSDARSDVLEGIAFVCMLKSQTIRNRNETVELVSHLPGILYAEEI